MVPCLRPQLVKSELRNFYFGKILKTLFSRARSRLAIGKFVAGNNGFLVKLEEMANTPSNKVKLEEMASTPKTPKQVAQAVKAANDPFLFLFQKVSIQPSAIKHLDWAKQYLIGTAFLTFRDRLKDIFTGKRNMTPAEITHLSGLCPSDPGTTNTQFYKAIGQQLISVHSSYLLMLLNTLHEELIFFIHPGQYGELLANYEEVSVKVLNHQGKFQTLQIKRYTGTKYPHWLGKAFFCGETQQRALQKFPDTSLEWMKKAYDTYYPVSKGTGYLSFLPPPEDPQHDGYMDELRRARTEGFSFLQNSNSLPLYFYSGNQFSLSLIFAAFVQRELQLLLYSSVESNPGEGRIACTDQHQFLTNGERFWFAAMLTAESLTEDTQLALKGILKTWKFVSEEQSCDNLSLFQIHALFTLDPEPVLPLSALDLNVVEECSEKVRLICFQPSSVRTQRETVGLSATLQMMEGASPPAPPPATPQDTRIGLNPPVEEMMGANSVDTSVADLLPTALNPNLIKAGGVLVDLKTLIYSRMFNLGEPIIFDYEKAHNSTLAVVSYGPNCFNPYGRVYSQFHRRFAGDFYVQIRMIGAAMFRGMLQVAVFEDKRATAADYNIVDGQRFQDHLLGANTTGSITYRLKFTHKVNYFWENEADLAGYQQTIALMVYINLINPFSNSESNVSLQLLSRCAENFIFALPTTVASNLAERQVVVPSDRLAPFVGKTIMEIVQEECGQEVKIPSSLDTHSELHLVTDGLQYPTVMIQNMDLFGSAQRYTSLLTRTANEPRLEITGAPFQVKHELGNFSRFPYSEHVRVSVNDAGDQAPFTAAYLGSCGMLGYAKHQILPVDQYHIDETPLNPFCLYKVDGVFPTAQETIDSNLGWCFPGSAQISTLPPDMSIYGDPLRITDELLKLFPASHVSYFEYIPDDIILQLNGFSSCCIAFTIQSDGTAGPFYQYGVVTELQHDSGVGDDRFWQPKAHVFKVVTSAGTGFLYLYYFTPAGAFYDMPLIVSMLKTDSNLSEPGVMRWGTDGGPLRPPPWQPNADLDASMSFVFPTSVSMNATKKPDLSVTWTVPSQVTSQYQNLFTGFVAAGFTKSIPFPNPTPQFQIGYDPTVMSLLLRAIRRNAQEIDGVVDLALVDPDFGQVAVTLRINTNTGASYINLPLGTGNLSDYAARVYPADASKLYISIASIKSTGQYLTPTIVENWNNSSVNLKFNQIFEGMTSEQLAELLKPSPLPAPAKPSRRLALFSGTMQAAIGGAMVGGGLLSGLGEGLSSLGNMWFQQNMQSNYFNQQQLLQGQAFDQQKAMAQLNSALWFDNQTSLLDYKSNLNYENTIRYQNLAGKLTSASQQTAGSQARGDASGYVTFDDVTGESDDFSSQYDRSVAVYDAKGYYRNPSDTDSGSSSSVPTSEGAEGGETLGQSDVPSSEAELHSPRSSVGEVSQSGSESSGRIRFGDGATAIYDRLQEPTLHRESVREATLAQNPIHN